MQKYCFSIKTRSGQFIERLLIAGKNREDAERKLNQMYRHCEIVRCEPHPQGAAIQQPTSIEDLLSLTTR
jgi:hypothetical protein